MYIADKWQEFEVLDAGDGMKLERWGPYTLYRPDPQAIWPPRKADGAWGRVDAVYHRDAQGGGQWEQARPLPERWQVGYGPLRFHVGLMGFKHTGLFPEQAVNWDWMARRIAAAPGSVEVLNLFAYTGGATAACAAAGAKVVHVDAAKGMVQWAKENLALCGLSDKPVRFIIEDCLKFVRREARRGRRYQGVVMDPPAYGRGPDGQLWKLEENLYPLLAACEEILAPDACFFLLNSYTTGLQPLALGNLLKSAVQLRRGGEVEAGEVGLPIRGGLTLPCGASARWRP